MWARIGTSPLFLLHQLSISFFSKVIVEELYTDNKQVSLHRRPPTPHLKTSTQTMGPRPSLRPRAPTRRSENLEESRSTLQFFPRE